MFYEETQSYKDYLPERLKGYYEIDVLDTIITAQHQKLNDLIKKQADNASIANADEDGVRRWEALLGLSHPLNSTLEARRDALKSRLMTKPPVNLKTLKNVIETYMGLGVDLSAEGYQITARYRGTSKISDLRPLFAEIQELIPASMLFEIFYLYITWQELGDQSLTFAQLNAKNLTWHDFERGEWIG